MLIIRVYPESFERRILKSAFKQKLAPIAGHHHLWEFCPFLLALPNCQRNKYPRIIYKQYKTFALLSSRYNIVQFTIHIAEYEYVIHKMRNTKFTWNMVCGVRLLLMPRFIIINAR